VKRFRNRAFLTDLLERTVATYVQTFLGLELSNYANLSDLGATKAAALAAIPAALAVVKAALKAKPVQGA
jgi:hypothetical protein